MVVSAGVSFERIHIRNHIINIHSFKWESVRCYGTFTKDRVGFHSRLLDTQPHPWWTRGRSDSPASMAMLCGRATASMEVVLWLGVFSPKLGKKILQKATTVLSIEACCELRHHCKGWVQAMYSDACSLFHINKMWKNVGKIQTWGV